MCVCVAACMCRDLTDSVGPPDSQIHKVGATLCTEGKGVAFTKSRTRSCWVCGTQTPCLESYR
jgi:hypothetical protein